MEIVIRTYEPRDKENCLAAFKSNVPLFFAQEETSDFERFLDTLSSSDAVVKSKTHFYVVEHQNSIIGCGGFGDKHGNNIITLAWGLIHSKYHKKGIGKALLEYRLDQIKKHYNDIPVYVDTTQHSHGFFERQGFQTTKITNDYYAAGMHRYDMVLNVH